MNLKSKTWVAFLGIGSLWAWSYLLFPSAGIQSPLLGVDQVRAIPDWHASLLVGTLVSIGMGCLRGESVNRLRGPLVLAGSFAQIICGVLMLVASETPEGRLVAGVCSGLALGILWVCWFSALHRVEAQRLESGLTIALLVNIAVFLAVSFLPGAVRVVLFFALAFIQLGAYIFGTVWEERSHTEAAPSETGEEGARQRADVPVSSEESRVSRVIACCVVAFAFVSFSGSIMAASFPQAPEGMNALYAVGMLLGVLMLHVFIRHSSSVDIFASIRWAFPIIAIALALAVSGLSFAGGVSVALMALCHIAFEGMTRLGIISLARRDDSSYDRTSAWGLAAISAGALLGSLVFQLCAGAVPLVQLVVYALAALVAVVLLLFGGQSPQPRANAPLPNEEVCELFRRRYALSPRETEVLGYLIEGRSSPYIRDELHISKGTVDTHVRHIYEKTGVASRQELITLVQGSRSR